ncbi:stage II sporulation protein D [Cohnella herbarum]|uniref:Stage II sporulation protein D n=1 Tax=Cohnella herbarum TaxID=2728023 RepID=A0A7Z2VL41_9BACL|nr:stage II sporulation protein D [Cohnella herbarum]QJD85286.1 stage II sporulation protein D [Cohnella herbarum]
MQAEAQQKTKNEPDYEKHQPVLEEKEVQPIVRVLLSKTRSIEPVPLEEYVKGVVAAEMPLDFQPEALEAQALAARTYIVRRLTLNDRSGVTGVEADVTDTQAHQVYRSLAEMKRLRKNDEEGWRKVDEAVKNTEGDIIAYRGQPIEALFFSTSNGYTENSEEVFPNEIPYLRSVASPWDKERSPRAINRVEMPLSEFYRKLGVDAIAVSAAGTDKPSLRIMEWTQGRRVKEMVAGSKRISGEEVREKLGLRSAAFDWTIEKGMIILTTYGSGHGVGMSQWGAEGMAQTGKTADQIVEYYYSGARVEKVSKLANSSKNRL